jgi:hypothetical protein
MRTTAVLGTLKVRAVDVQVKRWPVSGGLFEVPHNRAKVLADPVD